MNRKQAYKKLDKLEKNKTNCKFELLQNTLINFGFVETQSSGGSSHYKYTKDSIILVIPKKKPVKKVYVNETIKILEGLINEFAE